MAKELFQDRFNGFAASYPASRPAIVQLRRALAARPDALIEAEIGKLYQAASGDPERARHLLALRFYLCDVIETVAEKWWNHFNGFTYYADLLDRLGSWRYGTGEPVVLVTFNYDQLLDRSAEAQAGNWSLTTFSSYVDRPDWRLYKLHGSTNWARVLPSDLPDGDDANALIAHGESLNFERGALYPWHWASVSPSGRMYAAPGIAVPTDLKQAFSCPDEHVAQFAADIANVDRLLIIGWRAAEPHAIALLAEHIRPRYELAVCDVAEGDLKAVLGNLGVVGERAHPETREWISAGLGALVDPQSDQLERWLSLPI